MEAYRLEELDITAACQLNKKTIISGPLRELPPQSACFPPQLSLVIITISSTLRVSLSETIALGNNGPEEAVDGKREEREKTGMINGR